MNIKAEDYLPMVSSIAKKYLKRNQSVLDSEEFADGCLGLTKAINSFDPSRGNKFSTYAFALIRNEILSGVKRRKKIIERTNCDICGY